MCIIKTCQVNDFSRGKESYESILILAKVWEITHEIPLFWLIKYLILLWMASDFSGLDSNEYIVSS